MNKEAPPRIREAIHKLLHYGFQECTEEASRQENTEYLCAFEPVGEGKGVRYCCETEDDLFTLLTLVEAAASP